MFNFTKFLQNKNSPEFYDVDALVFIDAPNGGGDLYASEAIKMGLRDYIVPTDKYGNLILDGKSVVTGAL